MHGIVHRTLSLRTGVTLHVAERAGKLPAVVCFHGIWDEWRYFEPLLESGALDPYHAVMVDHRGHGESEKPDTGYGWDDYAADAVALIEAFAFERVILAGHSLGALTVLGAAPELSDQLVALLLEDPPVPMRGGSAEVFRILLDLKQKPEHLVIDELHAWRPFLTQQQVAESARRLIQTADGVLREAAERIESAQSVEIPRPGVPIEVPALVIQAGREEERAFGSNGPELLAEVIDDLRIETVPDTGHNVLRDRPGEYARIVRAWLDEFTT